MTTQEIYNMVEPLIACDTRGLWDWIEEGCFDGTETPQSIADEWITMCMEADMELMRSN